MKRKQELKIDILNFLVEFIKEKHYPPTIREVQEALDVKSTSTIHKYFGLLEKEGKIKIDRNIRRGIRVIQ